jgi:hypothetical protein
MTTIEPRTLPPKNAVKTGAADLGAEDARQGMTTGHMRWVLVISTFIVALLFIGLWFWFPRPSMTQSPAVSAAAPASAMAPGATTTNPAAQ